MGFDIGWNQIAFSVIDENEKLIYYNMHCYEEPILHNIFEKCLNLIDRFNPTVVGVECPFGRNPKALIMLSEVKGSIRLACQERERICVDMTPNQARAMTGKIANSDKDRKKKVIENTNRYYKEKNKNFPWFDKLDTENEHIADSVNVALYTLNIAKKELGSIFKCQ